MKNFKISDNFYKVLPSVFKFNCILWIYVACSWVHFSLISFQSPKCIKFKNGWLVFRVSTIIPGYGLRTEMIRKFFPFLLWKRFRKYRIPERFFPVNLKFLERCLKIMERPGILFRKIPVQGKGFRKTLKSS